MSNKYYRLVTFLVDIDTPVLRTLFVETARTDTSTGTPFTTMHMYMQARKPNVDRLHRSRKIRQDQYDLIYPSTGTTDEAQWDITLLCALLTGLFGVTLSGVRGDIDMVRNTRNSLQHAAGTAHITDTEFTTMWTNLKQATESLARQAKGSVYASEIEKEIEDPKTHCMANLGDVLRVWYTDHSAERHRELKDQMESIKDRNAKLSEEIASIKRKVEENNERSNMSASILEKATVKFTSSSGKPLKKIKTVNQIIINMRDSFKKTVIQELSEDFHPPKEIRDIRCKLRDKHIVVITGYANSPFLETALYVIQNKKYNTEKCLMLNDGRNWEHIEPEEVELVLFKNPFGDSEFDKPRAKTMFDILESVLLTVRDATNQMDVVIVSRTDIVKYIQENTSFWPDDLVDVVSLYEPATAERPVDIDSESHHECSFKKRYDPILKNLQELSAMVLRRHHIQPDEDVVTSAKKHMQEHKVVLLTGQSKDAIEAVVAELAKSYNRDSCLIMTKPDDIRHISLHGVCIVVAQYITGEFAFRSDLVHDWYTRLRQLEAAKHHGKLNIIITAYPEESLNEATMRYGHHSMLNFRVKVPATITVKPDPDYRAVVTVTDVNGRQPYSGAKSPQQESINMSVNSVKPQTGQLANYNADDPGETIATDVDSDTEVIYNGGESAETIDLNDYISSDETNDGTKPEDTMLLNDESDSNDNNEPGETDDLNVDNNSDQNNSSTKSEATVDDLNSGSVTEETINSDEDSVLETALGEMFWNAVENVPQCVMEMNTSITYRWGYHLSYMHVVNDRYVFVLVNYEGLYMLDLHQQKQTKVQNWELFRNEVGMTIDVSFIDNLDQFEIILKYNKSVWFINVSTAGFVTEQREAHVPVHVLATRWTYDKKRQLLIAATLFIGYVQINTMDRYGKMLPENKIHGTTEHMYMNTNLCICKELDLLYIFVDHKVYVYHLEQVYQQKQLNELNVIDLDRIPMNKSVSSDGTIYYTGRERIGDSECVYKRSPGNWTKSEVLTSKHLKNDKIIRMDFYNGVLYVVTVGHHHYGVPFKLIGFKL